MASVDYTYFTDADLPQINMKDWHTCLKAKHISLFKREKKKKMQKKKKPKTLCYSHCQFGSFAVLSRTVCLHEGPAPFFLSECMFVFICSYSLQIYHASASVMFTEEGLFFNSSSVTFLHSQPANCFSSACMYHPCSTLFQSRSVHLLHHFWFLTPSKCRVSAAVSACFFFWHKGLNLKCVHTALIY